MGFYENKSLLGIYLHDIARYQPLTLEQEQTLAERARKGDQEAREQLIEAYLILPVNIAKQYVRAGIDMMDLIQEGNIGLIKAVDMFDPAQGNRLSTLARFWVEKYILRFLRDEPDEYVSLDMPVVDSGETLLLSETIEDKATILGDQGIKNIDKVIEWEEQKKDLIETSSALPAREKQVLRLLYGLGLHDGYSVTEVAQILGISKVRVCELRDRALRKMRRRL